MNVLIVRITSPNCAAILRFGYELIRESDGVVIAEGETGHVRHGRERAVRSMPQGLPIMLLAPPTETETAGEPVPNDQPPG